MRRFPNLILQSQVFVELEVPTTMSHNLIQGPFKDYDVHSLKLHVTWFKDKDAHNVKLKGRETLPLWLTQSEHDY